MNEIEKISVNLDSEWWDAKDEEFWKDRIIKLVEYVNASEAVKQATTTGKHWETTLPRFRAARENLGLIP